MRLKRYPTLVPKIVRGLVGLALSGCTSDRALWHILLAEDRTVEDGGAEPGQPDASTGPAAMPMADASLPRAEDARDPRFDAGLLADAGVAPASPDSGAADSGAADSEAADSEAVDGGVVDSGAADSGALDGGGGASDAATAACGARPILGIAGLSVDGDLADWPAAAWLPLETYTGEREAALAGPGDLSASYAFAWAPEGLYVALEVTDDVHVNTHTPPFLSYADSFQLALAAAPGAAPEALDLELGFALLDGEPTAFAYSPGAAVLSTGYELAIQRSADKTTYEVLLSAELVAGAELVENGALALAVVVNDTDTLGAFDPRGGFMASTEHYAGGTDDSYTPPAGGARLDVAALPVYCLEP